MLYALDTAKVAVSASAVALDVALAESVSGPAASVSVAFAVAADESVIVFDPTVAMVAPVGIPVPLIVCPAARPVVEDTLATVVLPVAMVPVKATGTDAIVAPAGMPVPAIVCPTARSSVLEIDVTDALPFAIVPVKAGSGVVPLMVTTTFWFPVGIGV